MAVRIRLTRMGSKRKPFYRFVVADSRGKRDGGFLEMIGYYNPIAKPHDINVDEQKVLEWLAKGAEVSDGARDLLKKVGILSKWEAMRTGATGAEPEDEHKEVLKETEQEDVSE